MFYVYQILYKSSINLSKLSILSIYLRVFGAEPRRSWFPIMTYTLIVFIGAYTIASITSTIFECTPIQANWDTSPDAKEKKSRCISTLPFWYSNAIYNIVTEFLILLSAIVRIWSLSPAPNTDRSVLSATSSVRRSPLTQKDKYSLSFVFALGFFTVTTAILRMTTLEQTKSPDRTADTLVSTIWSTVEASCAILCANLPMLRIVVRECRTRWIRSWLDCERKSRPRDQRNLGGRQIGDSYLRHPSNYHPPCSPTLSSPARSPAFSSSGQCYNPGGEAMADLKGEGQGKTEYVAQSDPVRNATKLMGTLPTTDVSYKSRTSTVAEAISGPIEAPPPAHTIERGV